MLSGLNPPILVSIHNNYYIQLFGLCFPVLKVDKNGEPEWLYSCIHGNLLPSHCFPVAGVPAWMQIICALTCFKLGPDPAGLSQILFIRLCYLLFMGYNELSLKNNHICLSIFG